MVLAPRYKYTSGDSIRELKPAQLEVRNQLSKKISDGTYTLQEFPCSVCDQTQFEILSEIGRYRIQVLVKICKNCGLIQSTPRFNEESSQKFYENEYRKLYDLASAEDRFENQYKRSRDIFNYLKKEAEIDVGQSTVLEIGCGYGGLLKYFDERGSEIVGCDLDKDAIQFAQNKGLPGKAADVRELKPECDPDIIILDDVLEHLVKPRQVLEYISDTYSDGTKLYIEFPGVKRLGVFNTSYNCDFLQYIHIGHTHHFSLTSLSNLMNQAGYDMLIGDEKIKALFEISTDQTNTIQSDYNAVMDHLYHIEKFRKINYIYRHVCHLRHPHRHPILIRLLKQLGLYPYAERVYNTILK